MTTPGCPTIILGGGFTGLFTALHLRHQYYPHPVVLIDQSDRFCFKPLLYEYFTGEMEANQVTPRYTEILQHSDITFVQGSVTSIDLNQRQVQLVSGDSYKYNNLVLALGSVTGYFGVEGARENALPFRTQEDAIAIDRHLRDRLQRAVQLQDPSIRRRLLTIVVVGAGPSGVEMAATLADFLPQWYAELGGDIEEIRVMLVSHGDLLEGDVNSQLRATAEQALQQRTVPVEVILGAKVTTIHPNLLEYQRNEQTETLEAETIIWTTGTSIHPLIKSLPIADEHRDKHGRLNVTSTLQLPDFPEVFAGGDCAVDLQSEPSDSQHPKPLPPTAQVAYQQGAAIAYNLIALALGYDLKPAKVNLRGTLLKLGLNNSVANLFGSIEVAGEAGHLIRQATYLELLPTPIHNFKATTEWFHDEVIERYHHPQGLKQVAKTIEKVSSAMNSAISRRVTKSLLDDR